MPSHFRSIKIFPSPVECHHFSVYYVLWSKPSYSNHLLHKLDIIVILDKNIIGVEGKRQICIFASVEVQSWMQKFKVSGYVQAATAIYALPGPIPLLVYATQTAPLKQLMPHLCMTE